MIAEPGAVGRCLEFLEFSRGGEPFHCRFVRRLDMIDRDADPVRPFSWLAGC